MPPTAHRVRKASQQQIETARTLTEDLKQHQLCLTVPARYPSLADFGAADLSPIPLALLTRGGTVLAAGPSLFDLVGAQPDQVLFKPLAELLPPAEVPAFFKFLARCENTRQTRRAEFSISLPGRHPKPVLLVISPAEPDHPRRIFFRAAFVDLSDTEPPDFGPRPARENTRLVEVIDGILWEAVSPMRFTFVSRQAERILGFPADQWLHDPDFWAKHIYHEDRERVVQARAEAAQKPGAHVLEYRMLAADRSVIWVKDSAAMLAGAPDWTKMCGIITDITDVEHARENLQQAKEGLEAAVSERTAKMQQSLDAMETLCYGIAHDFKAPVRALEGFTGLIIGEYQEHFDDQANLYAGRCKIALRRMAELIDGVLSDGRLNHNLPELIPLNVRALIDRVLQALEPEISERRARIDVQISFPRVLANPYLLEQVFTNLVANALKFTKPDAPPEISISATQSDESSNPPIHESTNPSAPSAFVRITVTDNGIGMPPEATTRMFGMFQKLHSRDQYPGTGIGLAIVKRAVELMNGRVGALSEPGHGSSFWIELPASPAG
jgi:PAS domain S-box-containing protein